MCHGFLKKLNKLQIKLSKSFFKGIQYCRTISILFIYTQTIIIKIKIKFD